MFSQPQIPACPRDWTAITLQSGYLDLKRYPKTCQKPTFLTHITVKHFFLCERAREFKVLCLGSPNPSEHCRGAGTYQQKPPAQTMARRRPQRTDPQS